MREVQVGAIALAIFLAVVVASHDSVRSMILGMATGSVNVTIVPLLDVIMTLSLSNQTIVLGDTENFTVSVSNPGSAVSAPTQVKVTIYTFNGTDLHQEAVYSDSLIDYYPGILNKKFSAKYVPTAGGIYFVKANMSFADVEVFVWDVFVVYTTSSGGGSGSGTGTSNGTSGSSGGGGGSGPSASEPEPTVIVQIPSMDLDYPKAVKVEQGDSTVFAIDVGNSGTAYLHRLRVFVSSTSLLEYDVNPKQVSVLGPAYDYLQQHNTTFLISVSAAEDTPPGSYLMDFRVVSDQIDSVGKVTVTVLPGGALSVDDIRQRILSYGVIISDIERQMLAANRRGIDVSQVNGSLRGAISDLDEARALFERGEYGGARDGLDKVKKNLERATLQLATAEFFVYEPVDVPWLYIAAAALIAAGVGLRKYLQMRAKRRPRLIRDTPLEKAEE